MSDVRPSLYALADLIADKCKHSQCYDDDGHTDGCVMDGSDEQVKAWGNGESFVSVRLTTADVEKIRAVKGDLFFGEYLREAALYCASRRYAFEVPDGYANEVL